MIDLKSVQRAKEILKNIHSVKISYEQREFAGNAALQVINEWENSCMSFKFWRAKCAKVGIELDTAKVCLGADGDIINKYIEKCKVYEQELAKMKRDAMFKRLEIQGEELAKMRGRLTDAQASINYWIKTKDEVEKELAKVKMCSEAAIGGLQATIREQEKELATIKEAKYVGNLCRENDKLKELVFYHKGGDDDSYGGKTEPITWKEYAEDHDRYETWAMKEMKKACEKIKAHPKWEYGENAYPSPYERAIVAGCGRAVEDLKREVERVVDLLRLMLPMAKGYALRNTVGSNIKYIQEAEQFLENKALG